MAVETSPDVVKMYDVSHVQEAGTSAYYFRPPLGEAILEDAANSVNGASISSENLPMNVDHLTVPTSVAPAMIDRIVTLLRRESRTLERVHAGLQPTI